MSFTKTLKYIAAILITALCAQSIDAQEIRSRRSSICSIMVKHTEQKFADEIEQQFTQIPTSARFNDHNLSVRVVTTEGNITDQDITSFICDNKIASRLVARWFDRDINTGACIMDTIQSRGLYDATIFDAELAKRSARGIAMLADAGEDLISNTFLLVHEINYVDKAKRSSLWGDILGAAVAVAGAASGLSTDAATDLGNVTKAIASSYKGFSVKIHTRLYRLRWSDDDAQMMYTQCWTDGTDITAKNYFDSHRRDFALEYVGDIVSKGGRTSFLGIREEQPEIMIRKACARAIDQNIADLMHRFEPFRIKTPITSISPAITAPIGLKEGVTPSSKFEVLEIEIDENGRTKYKRVGIVRPKADRIWDNRFMASEENAIGADYGGTTFVTISGKNFVPGMLLREID